MATPEPPPDAPPLPMPPPAFKQPPAVDLLQHVSRDLYSLSSIEAYLTTTKNINARDKDGNTALMIVLRRCYQPMQLYDTCNVLLSAGCDINAVNKNNISATVYLCHHINRSLSFHQYADNPYTVAELDTVEAATDEQKLKVLCEQDTRYQQQVYECLELFVAQKADFTIVPDLCCEPIANEDKIPAFTQTLFLNSDRLSLLEHKSLAYSTYNTFDPLALHSLNDSKLNLLHVAAWRGDYRCLKLIAKQLEDCSSALQNTISVIRILVLYCNKPEDLLNCLCFLSQLNPSKVIVELSLCRLQVCAACIVKRSYMKFTCVSYTEYNTQILPSRDDHICKEVMPCLVNESDLTHDQIMYDLISSFLNILEDVDRQLHRFAHPHIPLNYKIDNLLYCKNMCCEHVPHARTFQTWMYMIPMLCICDEVNCSELVATSTVDMMPIDDDSYAEALHTFIWEVYFECNANPDLLLLPETVLNLLHRDRGLPTTFNFFDVLGK